MESLECFLEAEEDSWAQTISVTLEKRRGRTPHEVAGFTAACICAMSVCRVRFKQDTACVTKFCWWESLINGSMPNKTCRAHAHVCMRILLSFSVSLCGRKSCVVVENRVLKYLGLDKGYAHCASAAVSCLREIAVTSRRTFLRSRGVVATVAAGDQPPLGLWIFVCVTGASGRACEE